MVYVYLFILEIDFHNFDHFYPKTMPFIIYVFGLNYIRIKYVVYSGLFYINQWSAQMEL